MDDKLFLREQEVKQNQEAMRKKWGDVLFRIEEMFEPYEEFCKAQEKAEYGVCPETRFEVEFEEEWNNE